MKLFSEKVSPTFTSSNLNILTVKEFVEVFFDVFEFEINGNKFIAEKISEYKGFPVVEVPLVFEGKKLTAPFVLQQGEFEVLFNPDVSTIIGEAAEETPEPLIEYKESDDEIEELVLEKKETILKEIAQAKHSAAKYIERLKQQKLRETEEYLEEKQKIIETDLQESKKDLLEEFLVLVENVKSEFYSFNEDEKSRLEKFIESSIDRVSNELILSINHNRESAEERFSIHIDELANKVLTGVLLKEINHNNDKSVKDINTRFASISKSIETLFESNNKVIFDRVSNTLKDFNSTILTLEKSNIEIVDKLSKTNNKVLSRIGNVKNKLEESIAETTGNLIDRIEATESKIINYYNTNISLIENSLSGLVGESKNYFISLINESKQSLLEQIANLKVDVPNIVIERSRGGRQEIDLKGIKIELEKNISSRFSNEIQSLKRLIEMSSGGGSVAVQFADGGTMNGDLTIVGTISASQYLGIPIYTDTDTLSTVTGRGNTTNDSITVGGVNTPYVVTNSINVNTLSAITLSADRIFTTQLDALSANITVIDIKQYELSGFNVQGDATVQGSISASGNISASGSVTANNLVYKGGNTEGAALTIGTNDAQNLNFETNGSTRMSVTSAGLVAIGTATPSAKLDVVGTVDAVQTKVSAFASQTANTAEWYNNSGVLRTYITSLGNFVSQSIQANGVFSLGGQTALNYGANILNLGAATYWTTLNYGNASTITHNFLAGNVGIGTTSPSARLHTLASTEQLRLGYDASNHLSTTVSSAGLAAFNAVGTTPQFTWATGGVERMRVTSAGSVGIGTDTPSAKLTVVGSISATGILDLTTNQNVPIYIGEIPSISGYSGIWLGKTSATATSSNYALLGNTVDTFFNAGSNFLHFRIGNSNKMSINNSGNVGIGTTTPNQKLTVAGNISATGSVTANNLVYKGGNTEGAALAIGTNDAQNLNLETNGGTKMTVTSAGNVGIGTILPTTVLHTQSNTGSNFISVRDERSTTGDLAGIRFSTGPTAGLSTNFKSFISHIETGSNGLGDLVFAVDTSDVAADADITDEKLRIKSNGNVGIGTSSPAEKLSVSGNISTTGTIELGNASDTTLSRSAAGKLAVEGVDVVLAAGTQTVAGDKTLSGQLELTGQAATTANSAMNRSLVDARSLVSLQGSNQTINNVATYTASNMTLSLGVGTWELNGLFQTINAATGGAKIYFSIVSGVLPESYQHRFTTTKVNLGANNPIFGSAAPAYGSGSFPFRFDIGVSSGSASLFTLQPSVIVLTSAAQIDIGFSQNTAAVGNLTLYSFSKFWAKRLTH